MPSILWRRRGDDDDGYDDDDDWWYYSPTAEIVKWTVVAVILILLMAFFIGGYYHAQRRMRNGLRPLAYHRFLIPRRQRARFEPQPHFTFYAHQSYGAQGYPMNPYPAAPAPPPPYNPQHQPPPSYQPPQAGTKVNPDQNLTSEGQPGPSAPNPYGGQSSSAMMTPSHMPQPPSGESQAQLPPRPAKASLLTRLNPLKPRT